MYERMLKKDVRPSQGEIDETLGVEGRERMGRLEALLKQRYDLNRELCFPFGNRYGWGYKYSHRSKHLCHFFFEQGAFTVMLQLGDREVPALLETLPGLSEKAREHWASRYPCGEQGGWIQYRVLADADCADILALLAIKKKPARASLPMDLEKKGIYPCQ